MLSHGREAAIKHVALSVLVVAAFVISACSPAATTPSASGTATGSGAASASKKVTKIGIITSEKANDFGYNQQGVDSAKAVATKRGLAIDVADGSGYPDITPIIQQLVGGGANFIIAHASGYSTVAARVAKQLKVPVLVTTNPEANVPGLVGDVETSAQSGAYPAGVMAARMTKTQTVAVAMSASNVNEYKEAGGFVAGVRSVSKTIKINITNIGEAAFGDVAGGKRVTQSAIAAGADVIFGLGDGSSFGMLDAVETTAPPPGADKVWFIDKIGDKTSLDTKGVYLSSVLRDYSGVFDEAVAAIEAGTYGRSVYFLTVGNAGISLLKTKWIPDAVWTEIQKIQAGIADGSVKVPETSTQSQLDALLKQ